MNKKPLINQKTIPYILIAPIVVIFALFMVYPIIRSLYLSFFELVSGSYEFVGFQNYVTLFKDETFWKSLFNTFIFLIVQVPVMIGGALLIAVAIEQKFIKGRAFFRTTIFLMIILMAGIQSISDDLMEAADIDGATFWHKLFYITIPMVKPIILFCTITSTIGTLQLFDEPYILTAGGPNYATITMGQYLYDNGFRYLKFGYASAIGYVMTVIIALLSVFQFKATKEEN